MNTVQQPKLMAVYFSQDELSSLLRLIVHYRMTPGYKDRLHRDVPECVLAEQLYETIREAV